MTRLVMGQFEALEVLGAIRALSGLADSEDGVVRALVRHSPEWVSAALEDLEGLGQVDREDGRVSLTRDGHAHLPATGPLMLAFYREGEQRRAWQDELEGRG